MVQASSPELKTIEQATATVRAVAGLALKGLPPAVLREAAGVAILPHVVKTGLVLDERHGQGVILVHEPDGRWSQPVFVALRGRGIGLQAGIEATDLVLVFKTRRSLERALHGQLTLGTDASVAAGPLGHEIEKVTTGPLLRAEILSYSHSRGLFAGVALEGDMLHVDLRANAAFHGVRNGRAEDVLARTGAVPPAVELLRAELVRLGSTPVAVPVAPRGR